MSRRRPQSPKPGESAVPRQHRGRFWPWFWYCIILAPCLLWFVTVSSSTVVQAERAYGRGDLRQALFLATRELQEGRRSDRALMIAGEACLAARDVAGARTFLEQVSPDNPKLFSQAQRNLGRLALDLGRASEAEQRLRQSLQIVPKDPKTLDHLIYLLTLEGRAWEARQLVVEQFRAGVVNGNYVKIAGALRPSLEDAVPFVARCLSVVPNDPLPRLARAHLAWRAQEDDSALIAREELELVLRQYPDLIEAHALRGLILAETGTSAEFLEASERLPADAESHPDIWLARGIWADAQGQTAAAARCFWESVRREPNSPNANYRLSQSLRALGNGDLAKTFGGRAERLTQLPLTMTTLGNPPDPEKMAGIVQEFEALGRDWEAAAVCRMLLLEKGQQAAWSRAAQLRLSRRLWTCETLTAPSKDLSRQLDLSDYPLPVLKESSSSPQVPIQTASDTPIVFSEDADRAGLRFTYLNGEPGGELESVLEMNGGGVAVLDYDGDHWPDVYFTQGGKLPPAPFDPAHQDQLFRNRGADRPLDDHAFDNVTQLAGLVDLGYGQGVTVGDFDNDGFPDLYVGNIGRNQFYRNNGDGTFTDVTDLTGTPAGGWTSSSVIADFNHDGLPDLYAVAYLGGEKIFRVCSKKEFPRCSPLSYPGEPDRFYLNLGDGRFQELSGDKGLTDSDGRGLGVVAADFDGSRRLSLFVANDMTANFYFHNETTAPDRLQFSEQALLSGLAFDNQGRAMACMGVAADDYNQDGRLDVFITNFYEQSNDLYAQQPDGTFRDQPREAGLYEPSMRQLGWGTQFLDADFDGHPDLIVANGHVHDPLEPQVPYQMPPQFFRNQGNGTFVEIPSSQLGEFFQKPAHGRSLARLDWNRDGRDDACISHNNQPAALVTNRTESAGRFLTLRLVAVDSARDAIGTIVRVTVGDQTWTHQLTAGDGFHAANERRLVIGLGERPAIDALEVSWPSGTRQQVPKLELSREWLVIERQEPIELRDFSTGSN